MARNRANPTPEKPDAKTQEVFDQLEAQGFLPQLLSYGTTKRIVIRKGSREERNRRMRTNRNISQEREAK